MPGHDMVAIGASAGGVEALARLASDLPADFGAAVFVVLHFPADGRSMLHSILNRAGSLPAAQVSDGEPLRPGRIYVAQPDYHLLVDKGVVRAIRGPRENGHRPAVDPLFRSAARTYGSRVIGVVLTGNLDDGSAGLMAIKQRGGIAVVQDPREAFAPGMPRSALQNVKVDHCLPLAEIGPLLRRLVGTPAPDDGAPAADGLVAETEMAHFDMNAMQAEDGKHPGAPSAFSCPECHGVLWELSEGNLMRFRCRVGHAYTANTLLAEQTVSMEAALWAGLRALEEKASLIRRLARQAADRGHHMAQSGFDRRARETEEQAETIRAVLLRTGDGNAPGLEVFDEVALSLDGSSSASA